MSLNEPPTTLPLESPASPTEDALSPDISFDQIDIGKPKPYAVQLRLAIRPFAVQFRSPPDKGYVRPDTMDMLDTEVVKKTLQRTRENVKVREEIGTDSFFWQDMMDLVESAIPSVEQRCFTPPPPIDPAADKTYPPQETEFDGLSGQLIAKNCDSLVRDLTRLNEMVTIARNVLTIGQDAQDLASTLGFDKEIFRLVNLCVKVTARGYDGEPGSPDEDKWQNVVNAFKTVLMTSLQFLNNLVTQNERRKLMLWIQLFDSTSREVTSDTYVDDEGPESFANVQYGEEEAFESRLVDGIVRRVFRPSNVSDGTFTGIPAGTSNLGPVTTSDSSAFHLFMDRNTLDVRRQLLEQGKEATSAEIVGNFRQQWDQMTVDQKGAWDTHYRELLKKASPNSTAALELTGSINYVPPETSDSTGHAPLDEKVDALIRSINGLKVEADSLVRPSQSADSNLRKYEAAFGADILQRGKDDLMKRLEQYSERSNSKTTQLVSPASPVASPPLPNAAPTEERLEASEEEEESDDDEYVVPGDDGRGLLTDVPLILGPTEIEVLPMLIMAGIVYIPEGQIEEALSEAEWYEQNRPYLLHTARCYLLLAQDNGRNLLRELLIFVAAWDLRDEELYFKFMVKIMEAILQNGLMPFSYQAFKESKDIISPAQAVIMKLLTVIFKTRQTRELNRLAQDPQGKPMFPLQCDVDMVQFLFTEFRSNIIPQTCALIFLQGKIRANQASPEDFPLNLWDMERMYEGVYQYLEFFAILTEHDVWKKMMTDWDIISELVTLLRELDEAIPKVSLPMLPSLRTTPSAAEQVRRSTQAAAAMTYDPQVPTVTPDPGAVAVERPYDTAQTTTENTLPAKNPMPAGRFITEVGGFGNDSPADEPSEFEWRNLKKLAVLVLSSLVWRSRVVQDQVRAHKGIEAILNCCKHDEHNPYIREHAIMCIRFLLEGNKENSDFVKSLQPQGVVPSEALDDHGYESFMDPKGQVGLRRKQPVPPRMDGPTTWDRDPTDIAELVQNMMQELPKRMQGARLEAEKAAITKLDRGFEGSG